MRETDFRRRPKKSTGVHDRQSTGSGARVPAAFWGNSRHGFVRRSGKRRCARALPNEACGNESRSALRHVAASRSGLLPVAF